MSGRAGPRVFSIPAGAPFLPTLADAVTSGALIPEFAWDGDPLTLADVTIFVPTRRAARELRSVLAERLGRGAAILPAVRPLGEFEEDMAIFDMADPEEVRLAPPIAPLERLLRLAPLVRAWKGRLPAHIAAMFAEEVVVPASAADSIWLARDLAALIDEIETEGADWKKLGALVTGNLAAWWQVTLDFLDIVTSAWPQALVELDRSNPAAHRDALIRREASRLASAEPRGAVIAAGSTGSVPATAELLSVIARLPNGAVVLPGLDRALDDRSWNVLAGVSPHPSVCGHPQFGLAKLLRRIGIVRSDVAEIGAVSAALAARRAILSEALKPAETTDDWAPGRRPAAEEARLGEALAGVSLVEAANEREEAAAIAVALRSAIAESGATAALVATDRELARRVSAELLRFGIRADDSGGTPLARTPPAELLRLTLEAVFRPGNPVPLASLLKHPFLRLGMERGKVRHAAETIELVALRGGTGRPDVAGLHRLFDQRLDAAWNAERRPFWLARLDADAVRDARAGLRRIADALAPLVACRGGQMQLAELARVTVAALEGLCRDEAGGFGDLYQRDAGEKFVAFFRALVASTADFPVLAGDWPDIVEALVAAETVKPAAAGDGRVAIWGALEARLQTVGTLVIGGLNEGSWPRRAEPDRFMSRMMKGGLDLEPPERRIGLAAHDFMMAFGQRRVVLSRSARAGDAPATASRWLQRLTTFAGPAETAAMRARGDALIAWARGLDAAPPVSFAPRPRPKPPLTARPKRFSVTEIETLRRDPYAIYARHVLRLSPLDPLSRDPEASERGTLFHLILRRFAESCPDPTAADAGDRLVAAARGAFAEAGLPSDVEAVWWPRFMASVESILRWERRERAAVRQRLAEVRAEPFTVGDTGVTLSGYADRIDLLPQGRADILDFKTGSSPSRAQAHTLIAPQLALEAALLMRGAFTGLGPLTPDQLAYVRLKANGEVKEESILRHRASVKTAADLADDAWRRLGELLGHYADPAEGYLSRALPFREGEFEGDYDHLARVLEWSAGGDDDAEAGE